MNDEQLLELVAEVDPYGSATDLPESMSPSAVLLTIERRTDMDMQELTKAPPPPTKRGWRGPAIAAAIFAVVVVLGVAAAVLSAPDDGQEPVATTEALVSTSIPTTTTAAPAEVEDPAPSADDIAVIESMLEAHAMGDVDRLTELVAAQALLLRGPINAGNEAYDVDKLLVNARHSAAIGRTIRVVDCQGDNPITCDVEISDDFSNGVGLEPADGVMQFTVDTGRIVSWKVINDDAYDLPRMIALVQFEEWHTSTYPDDEVFYSTQGAQDHYYWPEAESSIEIAALRIAEYLEARGS